MPTFTSADAVHDAIGGVFTEALAAEDVGDELAGSGVVLQLRLTGPDAVVTVDMPNRAVYRDESGPTPTMVLRTTADVAHEYWLGNVNVGVAVARGTIRVKGSVPTLVRLAGVVKPLFPLYRARMGVTD